jgi:Tol biopolymer transport system component
MLVSRRRSQGTTSHPRWSPDGAYIAYQHLPDDYSSNGVSFIRRITVSGSGDTNLTPSGVSYQAALKDWR